MAHYWTEVEVRGAEYEVLVEGNVTCGGSNRYGSDEPEWVDVDGLTVCKPCGKPVGKRVHEYIMDHYMDTLQEQLIEAAIEG